MDATSASRTVRSESSKAPMVRVVSTSLMERSLSTIMRIVAALSFS